MEKNYEKMLKKELIDLLVKEPKKTQVVQNCTIVSKVWDNKALEAVNDTAKALLNMTELFKSTNIEVTGISIK